MHLVCVGPKDTGEPTILLEAGGGLSYGSWGDVLSSMLQEHRLCAYDRAGIGDSEPPTEASRTVADQVADLEALLDGAGISGPFVIGAHSVGAVNALLFTKARPDDVVGLVLVDPRAPRVSAEWLAALPAPAAGEPTDLTRFRDELTTFETDPSMNDEHVLIRDSFEIGAAALDETDSFFGDRPVVVLSAEHTPRGWATLPPDVADRLTEIWSDAQQALADESTAGSRETVPGVGHNIQAEAPEAVVDALERVLAQVLAS